MSKAEGVSISSLDPQRLNGLRESLSADIQRLADYSTTLNRANNTFQSSVLAVETLAKSEEGQSILLPLTASLYVSGAVASNSKVMVDIGTGYYVEMSTDDAAGYCKRRMEKLQESLASVSASIREKQGHISQVNQVLAVKMQSFQAAQAAAAQEQAVGAPVI
ncbi:MAG: hypothetical protein WDW38_003319 [Sanguina aurantia]